MTAHKISNWEDWQKLCVEWGYDPHEIADFSIDEGGGNSTDFEYIGDYPEKEE